MWNGKGKDPPCITIFSAPNYCGHENPASIFVTDKNKGSAGSKILVYEEYHRNTYFLPDYETGEHPDDPFDVLTWFMPAFREWTTQFFNTVISKINEKGELIPDTEENTRPGSVVDTPAGLEPPTSTEVDVKISVAGTEKEEVKTLVGDPSEAPKDELMDYLDKYMDEHGLPSEEP